MEWLSSFPVLHGSRPLVLKHLHSGEHGLWLHGWVFLLLGWSWGGGRGFGACGAASGLCAGTRAKWRSRCGAVKRLIVAWPAREGKPLSWHSLVTPRVPGPSTAWAQGTLGASGGVGAACQAGTFPCTSYPGAGAGGSCRKVEVLGSGRSALGLHRTGTPAPQTGKIPSFCWPAADHQEAGAGKAACHREGPLLALAGGGGRHSADGVIVPANCSG